MNDELKLDDHIHTDTGTKPCFEEDIYVLTPLVGQAKDGQQQAHVRKAETPETLAARTNGELSDGRSASEVDGQKDCDSLSLQRMDEGEGPAPTSQGTTNTTGNPIDDAHAKLLSGVEIARERLESARKVVQTSETVAGWQRESFSLATVLRVVGLLLTLPYALYVVDSLQFFISIIHSGSHRPFSDALARPSRYAFFGIEGVTFASVLVLALCVGLVTYHVIQAQLMVERSGGVEKNELIKYNLAWIGGLLAPYAVRQLPFAVLHSVIVSCCLFVVAQCLMLGFGLRALASGRPNPRTLVGRKLLQLRKLGQELRNPWTMLVVLLCLPLVVASYYGYTATFNHPYAAEFDGTGAFWVQTPVREASLVITNPAGLWLWVASKAMLVLATSWLVSRMAKHVEYPTPSRATSVRGR